MHRRHRLPFAKAISMLVITEEKYVFSFFYCLRIMGFNVVQKGKKNDSIK